MVQQLSDSPSVDEQAGVPVVGIGASAGGVAAAGTLLRALGDAPNLSIVVLQHLSRDHESALVSMLQRATRLPVVLASEGEKLEANHVYVAPPTSAVVLERGCLRLVPRPADGGLEHPIDRLFYSLALARGPLAIGVVLSGAGSDGAFGVKAIKLAGGITLAQDASAEFNGMPSAAAATGCVDFVLAAEGIANQLLRFARRLPIEHAFTVADDDFRRLLRALRLATGMDFSGYKEATVRRRVERRSLLRRSATLKEYLELVEREPAEARTLAEEMLIHVTSFFRDPAAFDSLKRNVFPRLLERPSSSTIRIWVPGCSTGEEVYSLAIGLLELLQERGGSRPPIRLFGTDASEVAIQTARSACYTEGIETSVSADRLARYFSHVGGLYRINRELRELCVFARHDVTRDPPFSRVDLISCRNLMIYLTTAAQERLLPMFQYVLNDPGFLLLGPAETARSQPGFAEVDEANRIYERRPGVRRLPFAHTMQALPEPATIPVEAGASPSAFDLGKHVDQLLAQKYAPCGVVCTNQLVVVQFRGKTGRYLEPAPGAARFDLLKMVRDELRLPLRRVIDDARAAGSARRTVSTTWDGGAASLVELEVVTLGDQAVRHFLVLFREVSAPSALKQRADTELGVNGEAELQAELASAREYLEAAVEQLEETNEALRAANEEITSNNEELRSTNEELQVAKEELQATNQELVTINDEMMVRNQQATRLADDLTNVLNSVDVPVLILDRESKIRRFTPAAAALFELDVRDMGRELAGLNRPFIEDCKELALQVREQVRPVVRSVQGADGRWHVFHARPYLTTEQKVEGSIISAFDVDAVAGTGFRELLTGASEGMLMVAGSGRIVFANQAAAALFGYAPDELLGLEIEALVPQDRRPEHQQARTRYLALASARLMASKREVLGLKRDGTTVPLEVTLNPARGPQGQFVIAFVKDVTEQRKKELEIRTYQSRLQHMAFDAAVAEERERRRIALHLHDNIGQGMALARIKLSEARDEASGTAREAIDDAMLLLAQSLESARTITFDLSPPILYDLGLKSALSWLAEDLEQRFGLRITLRMDQSPTPLEDASAALVFRAVRELLINVLKHAQLQEAELSVRNAGDSVQIVVEDRGVGFDPSAARPGNAGFGLMSVREQIVRLGGSLDVVSAVGQGTHITIKVPLSSSVTTPGK